MKLRFRPRFPVFFDNVRYRSGDAIRAGAVIGSIRATELLKRLRQAEAALNAARAEAAVKENRFKESKTELERTRDLWRRDLIARQDLSRARPAVAAARAAVDLGRAVAAQQQATVAQIRYQSGFDKIVAPFDGVISRQLSRPGSRVRQGQAILLYESLDSLRIKIPVADSEAHLIEKDLAARITVDEFPNGFLPGRCVTSRRPNPTARERKPRSKSQTETTFSSPECAHPSCCRWENSRSVFHNSNGLRERGGMIQVLNEALRNGIRINCVSGGERAPSCLREAAAYHRKGFRTFPIPSISCLITSITPLSASSGATLLF